MMISSKRMSACVYICIRVCVCVYTCILYVCAYLNDYIFAKNTLFLSVFKHSSNTKQNQKFQEFHPKILCKGIPRCLTAYPKDLCPEKSGFNFYRRPFAFLKNNLLGSLICSLAAEFLGKRKISLLPFKPSLEQYFERKHAKFRPE